MSDHGITPDGPTRRILGALVAWNLVDIAVHVVVDEIEIVRVSANILLVLAAAAMLLGRADAHPAHPLVIAAVAYLALNVAFVFANGPAVPMTVFIVTSIVLAGAAAQRLRPPPAERRLSIPRS